MELILTGVKEIDQVLRELPLEMNHRVIGAANATAAKPMVDMAKRLVLKDTDRLEQSIAVVKTPISSATNLGEVQVGPRLKRGGYKGHWVEYGTRPRYTKGRGKYKKPAYRGVMKPHPFMKPAFDATKDIVLAGIRDQIGIKLLAVMRRTIKKAA